MERSSWRVIDNFNQSRNCIVKAYSKSEAMDKGCFELHTLSIRVKRLKNKVCYI